MPLMSCRIGSIPWTMRSFLYFPKFIVYRFHVECATRFRRIKRARSVSRCRPDVGILSMEQITSELCQEQTKISTQFTINIKNRRSIGNMCKILDFYVCVDWWLPKRWARRSCASRAKLWTWYEIFTTSTFTSRMSNVRAMCMRYRGSSRFGVTNCSKHATACSDACIRAREASLITFGNSSTILRSSDKPTNFPTSLS